MKAIEFARKSENAKVVAGGKGDDKVVGSCGRPYRDDDPDFKLLRKSCSPHPYVYPYADGNSRTRSSSSTGPALYGLTGRSSRPTGR